MTVTLATVPDVPILSTGTYQLASGETTFSQEDLADAVRAASDPTVPAPRIKLGHTDPRFDQAVASGELDGEPAFGTVQNLRLSDDGQTILGDYVDVPEWLADTLQSSYPGRSIEGGFGVTMPSGRQYKLVIAAVALLGVTWPGVTSLADLREILEKNGQAEDETVEDASETFVIARVARPDQDRVTPTVAGIDLGSARQMFCADLDEGEVPIPDSGDYDLGSPVWWWPRSIRVEDDGSLCFIVDDDAGHLIQIPFTVNQNELEYGTPQVVVEQYVPVAASGGSETRTARLVRAASRPSNTTEVQTMDVDAAVLRKRLGLSEDADDAAIQAALEAEPTAEPEAPASPDIPEGMTLVDSDTWEQVKSGAEQGVAVAARIAQEDRDKIILAAIKDGKFAVSRREHYEKLWAADEQGTRELIAKLEPGLVPANKREIGHGGDGESTEGTDAAYDGFFASHFPKEHARLAGRNGRTRVRQEA